MHSSKYIDNKDPNQIGYSSFYELSAHEIINYFCSQNQTIKQIIGLLPKFILHTNVA